MKSHSLARTRLTVLFAALFGLGLLFSLFGGEVAPPRSRAAKPEIAGNGSAIAFKADPQQVTSLTFSPDGTRLVTQGSYWAVRLWDASKVTLLHDLYPPTRDEGLVPLFDCAAFTPDGKTVIAPTSQRILRAWDTFTGRETTRYAWDKSHILSFALSPDGRMLVVQTQEEFGGQLTLHVLERATRKDRLFITYPPANSGTGLQHAYPLILTAFTPDGRALATAAESNRIQLWDLITGREIRQFVGHDACLRSLAFSPDGCLLASSAGSRFVRKNTPVDHTLRLWDVATGKERLLIETTSRGIAFSPDGRILATADADDASRLREVVTGKVLLVLHNRSYTNTVAFSPNGDCLASGGINGWVSIVPVAPPDADALTSDKLTPRERTLFWTDLASEDGPTAFRAVYALSATPTDAIVQLKQRLRPVPSATAERISQVIAEMNAADFEVRAAAWKELGYLGPQALAALRKELAKELPEEFRNRAERFLDAAEKWLITDPETLRAVRAVWVLERIGSADARKLLEELAAGAADARPTQHAKAALLRLKQQAAKP